MSSSWQSLCPLLVCRELRDCLLTFSRGTSLECRRSIQRLVHRHRTPSKGKNFSLIPD